MSPIHKRFYSSRWNMEPYLVAVGLTAMAASIGVVLLWPSIYGLLMAADIYAVSSIVLLIAVVISRSRAALSLVTALFLSLFFAVPCSVQLYFNHFPWPVIHNIYDLRRGFCIMAAGHLLIWLGLMTKQKKAVSRQSYSLNISAENMIQLVLVSAGCVFVYVCMPIIGFTALLGSRATISDVVQQDSLRGQLIFICRSVAITLFCVSVIMFKNSKISHRVIPAFLVCITGLSMIVFDNPRASPRYQFLAMTMAVATIVFDMRSRATKAYVAASAFVFTVVVFPVLKLFSLGTSVDFGKNIESRGVLDYLLTVDFDPYQWIVNTAIYLDGKPIRWGNNIIGAILFFIPRGIWKAKPEDSGTLVSEVLGYKFNSVSSPLQAEGLLAFGAIGMILLCLFFGMAIRSIEDRSQIGRNSHGNQLTVIYAFLAGFIPIILRGALNANAPQFGSGLAFMLIFHYMSLAVGPRRSGISHGKR